MNISRLKKELIQELFIEPSNTFSLPRGNQKDLEMIRVAMIAELDAVSLYERMAAECSSPEAAKVFQSVADEEQVHAGEFEFLLDHS